MTGLLAILIAYLIGSIPFGFLLTKLTTGKDVRATGSGNIGATNVLRAAGRAAGVATLLLDMAKGFAAVWIASLLTANSPGGSSGWAADAALAVMAGHSFPVFLGFKGGKAVATFLGAFAYLMPLPLLAAWLVFMITIAVTRYVSAASVMAAATFPLGVWLILHPTPTELVVSIIAGAFIVVKHKPNLDRIRAGTEPVFRWRTS